MEHYVTWGFHHVGELGWSKIIATHNKIYGTGNDNLVSMTLQNSLVSAWCKQKCKQSKLPDMRLTCTLLKCQSFNLILTIQWFTN